MGITYYDIIMLSKNNTLPIYLIMSRLTTFWSTEEINSHHTKSN